jgi:isopenicillin N synthase-like dioxygenase
MAIPVVDLARFERGTESDKLQIAHQIDLAARQIGFMQLSGHGLSTCILQQLQQSMDDFFGLPLGTKNLWQSPDPRINRGYSPPLAERLSYSIGVDSPPDLFESFNIGSAWTDFPGLNLDHVTYPNNIWPDHPSHFRECVEAWFHAVSAVARRVTRLFAFALNLPPDFFEPYQDHSLDVLRLNCYATRPQSPVRLDEQMGMGAHTDYGIVTILWADAVEPGLQVLDRKGRWHDAAPMPGNLLINIGDMMARWTNDRWLSSLHRVKPPVNAQGQLVRRRSAAFFHDGNADAMVSCLPGCADEMNPVRYAPITVAEHIRQKLEGSRGLALNPSAVRESARLMSSERGVG